MRKWLDSLTAKRAISIALGPGILAIGVDAWIAHLVGKPLSHPAQYVPIAYAPIATLLVLAVAVPKLSEAVFTWTMRAMGALGVLIGIAGTWFHLRWLLGQLEGPITQEALEELLPVAPPLFAPAAFAGLGLLLVALGSRSLLIRFQIGSRSISDAEPGTVVPIRTGEPEAPTGTGSTRS